MHVLHTLMLAALALTSGASAQAARPAPSPSPNPSPGRFVAPPAHSLYAREALREMRAYLRLRMLELHEADLDRVRAVVEGRLGIDALLPPASPRPAR
jgi:hypothetical protein